MKGGLEYIWRQENNMKTFKLIFKAWLPFAVMITAFCALVYASVQQAYRQSANDPQIQMAEDAADALADGGGVDMIIPTTKVSVAKSLAPFLIAYDTSGNVIAASVTLDGQTPALPAGVLDSAKQLSENRVTWQPREGIRIAAVIVSYKNGYVLAGRSLHEVEARESQLTTFAGVTWILALLASFAVIMLGELFLKDKS
jgi:hypothetical protein